MGTLPFKDVAALKARPNTTIIASLPITIWPAGPRTSSAGVHYDHEAEAPAQFVTDLKVPNRFLEMAGEKYVVTEAVLHGFLPHVALRLRASSSTGV